MSIELNPGPEMYSWCFEDLDGEKLCYVDYETLSANLVSKSTEKYLVSLYYNEEKFDSEFYGDKSIVKASKIKEFEIDIEPNQLNFDLQSYLLNDSSDLVQFGNGK